MRPLAAQRAAREPGCQVARPRHEPVEARHVDLVLAARARAPRSPSATCSGVPTSQRVCGAAAQPLVREALGRDEPGQHDADVHAVRLLLEPDRLAPAGERELRRRVGAVAWAARPAPAIELTLTIELGDDARSSGSSASVSRTTASKLTSIVRRTFA